MGRQTLRGMLEVATQDQALEWHLRYNHYPPLPLDLKPVAKEAIDRAREGDLDSVITMPPSVQFRGKDFVSVRDAIETMHLSDFIDTEEE